MFFLLLLLIGLGVLFFLAKTGRLAAMSQRGQWAGPAGGPGAQPGTGEQRGAGAPAWGPQPRPEDDALKLLADRLASGDITPDEYLERVSVLRQQP